MIYAITGHTRGIGAGLYSRLSKEHNVIGFSKSTGYDITSKSDRSRIVEKSDICDIFINNATDHYGQTELFLDLLDAWREDESKTIINVGSRIAEIVLPMDKIGLIRYQSEKVLLKTMSILTPKEVKCKVLYRWFAYVGTENILNKYPHFRYPEDYITIEEACDIILS